MFSEPLQNLRQLPACFARRNEIDKERWKNSRHLAQGLRKTSAVDQRLVQRPRHLLHARLLEPLFQDRQSLVQRHSSLEQMGELLGENEQLTVRNFQSLRWRRGSGRRFFLIRTFRPRPDRFDPDWDATLLLDLRNGNRAVGAIQHSLDQLALRIAGSIGKLWHRTGK